MIEAMPVAGAATRLPEVGRRWPRQGEWTYEDFLALADDGNRYEIVEGVLYVSPPPAPRHQSLLGRLYLRVGHFVDANELGLLFLAPIGLLMPNARPVQPDLFFLAADNPAEIDWDRHVVGVPDLVVEVASPSTAGYDRREKQDAYARAGVREYWLVDPGGDGAIELLRLDASAGKYESLGLFGGASLLPTQVLAGLPDSVATLLS